MARQTENLHPDAEGLDAAPGAEVLRRLLDGQAAAISAVSQALGPIAEGAARMARAVRGGHRLIYAGAGSSALAEMADGLELPGTFGIDPTHIVILMAGGLPENSRMPGATEDDTAAAARDAEIIGAGDVLIAATASGSTPYTCEVARIAQARGAETICIANNADAPIFAHADTSIHLPTPPELIAGSTRMGAGTAQKVCLNMMSTLMGVRLGHVHDGMMVNLMADNEKLRGRAVGIVARIAGCPDAQALTALDQAGGAVKPAVLIACGATLPDSERLLNNSDGNLRAALAQMNTPAETGH